MNFINSTEWRRVYTLQMRHLITSFVDAALAGFADAWSAVKENQKLYSSLKITSVYQHLR